MTYRIKQSSNALGITYEFHGPMLSRYANDFMPIQQLNDWAKKCLADDSSYPERQAERIVGFLNLAFEAGKQARSAEFLALLRTGEA